MVVRCWPDVSPSWKSSGLLPAFFTADAPVIDCADAGPAVANAARNAITTPRDTFPSFTIMMSVLLGSA